MAAPKEKQLIPVMAVLDTETGGTDCQKCGVCQVCIHAVRLDTFERFDSLNIYIKPYNKRTDFSNTKRKTLKTKYEIEEEGNPDSGELLEYGEAAEKVHGLSLDFLRNNGVTVEEAGAQIIKFMKSCRLSSQKNGLPFFVGQNILFDIAMIENLMEYAGMWGELCKLVQGKKDFYGNFQPLVLDTMHLGYLALCNTNITSYALGNLCEVLGIEIDDAHDAHSDVTATEEIVKIMTSRMRSSNNDGDVSGELMDNKKDKKRVHFKI